MIKAELTQVRNNLSTNYLQTESVGKVVKLLDAASVALSYADLRGKKGEDITSEQPTDVDGKEFNTANHPLVDGTDTNVDSYPEVDGKDVNTENYPTNVDVKASASTDKNIAKSIKNSKK